MPWLVHCQSEETWNSCDQHAACAVWCFGWRSLYGHHWGCKCSADSTLLFREGNPRNQEKIWKRSCWSNWSIYRLIVYICLDGCTPKKSTKLIQIDHGYKRSIYQIAPQNWSKSTKLMPKDHDFSVPSWHSACVFPSFQPGLDQRCPWEGALLGGVLQHPTALGND